MADPIIKGSLAPKKQATEVVYDPERGQQVIERWRSAGRNCGAQADLYLSMGVAYNFVDSPVISELTATSSNGGTSTYAEVITDSWQILANEVQKDIFECDKALYMEQTWPGTIFRIRRDISDNLEGNGSPAPAAAAMAYAGTALKALAMRGGTHFAVSQYVLHHTTSVSNRYTGNIADININKVYTSAQLISECTNGALWVNPMPARLAYKINAIPAPDSRTGYLWGWRKLASTETTAAGYRIEITTEYVLDQWPLFHYPAI